MGSSNKVFVWLSLMLAVALLLFMISSSEVSAARDLAEATKSTSTASKPFIKNNKKTTKPATGVDEKKKCGGYGVGNGGYGGDNGGGYGGGNGGYGGDNGGGYGGGNGGYGGGNGGYGGDNGGGNGGYGGDNGGGYGGGNGGNGGYGGDNGGGYGGNGGNGGYGGNGGGGYGNGGGGYGGNGGGGYGGNNGGYGSGGGGYGGQGTDIAYDPIKTSSEGVKYKGSSSSVKSIPAAPLGGSVASGYKGVSSKSSTPEDDKLQAKAVETKANKP